MDSARQSFLPLTDKIAYGAGNFATGISMQILGTYLVFYSTAVLGLPGSIIGAVMGGSILWDAVTDPVMGYISDKTPHKGLGRRHPYMIFGALGIALTNYLVWNIDPRFNSNIKMALICALVILLKTFLTVYVTPYTALGAELSMDYNERTRIQSIKAVFFVFGLGFVSVAGLYWFFRPAPGYPLGQLNPAAYSLMALVSSLVVLVSALVCIVPTIKQVPRIQERSKAFLHEAPANFKDSVTRAFKNTPYRRVVLAYMFSNLASAFLANLGLLVFTYTFGLGSGDIAMIIGIQFFFAIISQAPWAVLSRKKSKRYALIGGFLLSLLGTLYFTILVFLQDLVFGKPWVFLPFSITVGFGIGALFTLPLSMVADTVDLDEAEGGSRNEGVYFGTLTLVYKLAQALTLVLIGFFLDLSGFDSSLQTQERYTLLAMGLVLGLGGLVCFVFAIISIWRYDLDQQAVAACRERILALRRAGVKN